jgi:glycosyltransferase involved in cell wall biosynthesis
VPTAEDRAKARASLGLAPDSLVIGNAGWLIPRKRFDVFMRVAQAVLARIPNAVFVIAGGGPERESLESLARELGISASLRWLGWRQEMSSFYKSLDVLLFNSDWDALCLTPQEAMSFGVPVVCSILNGGLGEIIDSDRYGYLRGTHDVKGLTDLVVQLLQRPDLAADIGHAARKHIEEICRAEPIVEWHERALLGQAGNGC